jgi:hypothetical protein
MTPSAQNFVPDLDNVIEKTNVGVPNSPTLFKEDFPWVMDLSARYTIDPTSHPGTFNPSGKVTFRTLTARNWTHQDFEGKTEPHADFGLATSLVTNRDATHRDQRRFNLLCRDMLLLSMAIDDMKAVTQVPATLIKLTDGQKGLKRYYKGFERHLRDENKDEDWTERHSEITLNLASKAEELSAFFWHQKTRPPVSRIDTTISDRRLSWEFESAGTPEQCKGEGYDQAKKVAPESKRTDTAVASKVLKRKERHGR